MDATQGQRVCQKAIGRVGLGTAPFAVWRRERHGYARRLLALFCISNRQFLDGPDPCLPTRSLRSRARRRPSPGLSLAAPEAARQVNYGMVHCDLSIYSNPSQASERYCTVHTDTVHIQYAR